jgi:hypothetical protein
VSEVCGKCEKIYHELFGTRTPQEILYWLRTYWWKPMDRKERRKERRS